MTSAIAWESRYSGAMSERSITSNPELGSPEHARTVVEIIDEQVATGIRRLTPMGKQLLESRRQLQKAGVPLLSREELDRERAERRGGIASE